MAGGPRTELALALLLSLLLLAPACGGPDGGRVHELDGPWKRHEIDNSLRGADGVRVADVNGDGFADITTGWEKDGITRAYLHPGVAGVREHWPVVTVGQTPDVEDAVWADLDRDGSADVVSSSEGSTRAVFVSFAPRDAAEFLDASAWTSAAIPATEGRRWMYALPLDVDGKNGIDLVVGGKGDDAIVAWLEAPADARELSQWVLHEIGPAGWVMSIDAVDVNDDGRPDLLVSDHAGGVHGVRWLEHPDGDEALRAPWPSHFIGAKGRMPVFIAPVFTQAGSVESVLVPSGIRRLTRFRREGSDGLSWLEEPLGFPTRVGHPKSVAVGDLDLDGELDVVIACTNLTGLEEGIFWLPGAATAEAEETAALERLSGAQGEKFDRVELVDLDDDGDLDLLTTEELQDLGVVWYENPLL